MYNPKLFVGSSGEARKHEIPQTFCQVLKDDVQAIPWWLVPQFAPTTTTFDALVQCVKTFDFGLFILTPDDNIESRGVQEPSARDNVLFELGLFLGSLGPERTFAVIQQGTPDIKIPSDLQGVTLPRFSPGDDLLASANQAAHGIRTQIKKAGFNQHRMHLANRWWFDIRAKRFTAELSSVNVFREREMIGGRRLCVVVRVKDPGTNFDEDTAVLFSVPRSLPAEITDDIRLETTGPNVFDTIEEGDVVQAKLLALPSNCDPMTATCLRDVLAAGGIKVDSMSYKVGKATCPNCSHEFLL